MTDESLTVDRYDDETETDDGPPPFEMLDLRETDPTFIPPDEDQVDREEGLGHE